MASSFGAVKERTYTLIETGEYVFTLNDLTEESGQYGDAIKFVWLVAPKDTPTDYIALANGMEKTIHVYTDADIIIGGQNHEFIQALTGRTIAKDDPLPDDSELLGKRMLAYLTHQAPKKGPNAGKLREKIVAGSCKPYRLPGQRAPMSVIPAMQIPADPTDEDIERAVVVTKLQKQVAKLSKLNAENGAAAQAGLDASDLDTAPLADLERFLIDVNNAVAAALDD